MNARASAIMEIFSGKVCSLNHFDGFQRPPMATHNIFITIFYRAGGLLIA